MKSIAILSILLFLIISTKANYNSPLALHLGYMSIIAYESTSVIQSWKCSYCSRYSLSDPKVFSNSSGGIQGFTGYSHSLNSVIVSFRGSNNIQNWILNIGTTRTTYPKCSGCSVHSGFYSGYNMVASNVRATVNSLMAKYRGARLMITGHSLGGALAILAAADLRELHGVDEVYTFGQPRVGNAAFAHWYPGRIPNTFRVVDYADIVPHVPPSNLGFQHSSKQAWYQRGMQTYTLCDAEAATCANSISTLSYSTDDHNMSNYIKLKSLSEQQTGLLAKLIQKLNNLAQNINLRQSETEKGLWQDEQERKVKQQIDRLRNENIPAIIYE